MNVLLMLLMLYQENAVFFFAQADNKEEKKLCLFYLFSLFKLILQDKRMSALSIVLLFSLVFFLQLKDKGKKGTQTH